jgi:hypothetical protein
MEHVEDPSEEEIQYCTKSRDKYQLQYKIIAVMLCRKKNNV